MGDRNKILRSTVPGKVPEAGTRRPGELWVNFADAKMGIIDNNGRAQILVPHVYMDRFEVNSPYITDGPYGYELITGGASFNYDPIYTLDYPTKFTSRATRLHQTVVFSLDVQPEDNDPIVVEEISVAFTLRVNGFPIGRTNTWKTGSPRTAGTSTITAGIATIALAPTFRWITDKPASSDSVQFEARAYIDTRGYVQGNFRILINMIDIFMQEFVL